MNKHMEGSRDGCLKGYRDEGCMEMDGWMDRLTRRRMDEWIDIATDVGDGYAWVDRNG